GGDPASRHDQPLGVLRAERRAVLFLAADPGAALYPRLPRRPRGRPSPRTQSLAALLAAPPCHLAGHGTGPRMAAPGRRSPSRGRGLAAEETVEQPLLPWARLPIVAADLARRHRTGGTAHIVGWIGRL